MMWIDGPSVWSLDEFHARTTKEKERLEGQSSPPRSGVGARACLWVKRGLQSDQPACAERHASREMLALLVAGPPHRGLMLGSASPVSRGGKQVSASPAQWEHERKSAAVTVRSLGDAPHNEGLRSIIGVMRSSRRGFIATSLTMLERSEREQPSDFSAMTLSSEKVKEWSKSFM